MRNGQMPSRWGQPVDEEGAVLQPGHRADGLASDSQLLRGRERRANLDGKKGALARRLADEVDMEDLLKIAVTACRTGLRTPQASPDAPEDEWEVRLPQMTAGAGRFSRIRIADVQPRAQIPKRAKLGRALRRP